MSMQEYKFKKSGTLTEVIVREEGYIHPRKGGRHHKSVTLIDEVHAQKVHTHSISNTIRNFKRLVYANFSESYTLLTLTFNPNECDFDITDISVCKEKFAYYWSNLKRGKKKDKCFDGIDMRYLGVIEFHDSGNIHFHILCHIPRIYSDTLQKKWQHGHLDFRRSAKDPLAVRKINNYLKKGIYDARLQNEKQRYLSSRNLKRTVQFTMIDDQFPEWLEKNGEFITNPPSQYGFDYYEYSTTLSEEEFAAYFDSTNSTSSIKLTKHLALESKLANMDDYKVIR